MYWFCILNIDLWQQTAEYSLPDMRYSPFGSTARLVTESRWATIEWISLPSVQTEETQNYLFIVEVWWWDCVRLTVLVKLNEVFVLFYESLEKRFIELTLVWVFSFFFPSPDDAFKDTRGTKLLTWEDKSNTVPVLTDEICFLKSFGLPCQCLVSFSSAQHQIYDLIILSLWQTVNTCKCF